MENPPRDQQRTRPIEDIIFRHTAPRACHGPQQCPDYAPVVRRFVERLAAGHFDQAVIEEIVSSVFQQIGNVPPRTDVKSLLLKRACFLTKNRIPPEPWLTPEEVASLRAVAGTYLDRLTPAEAEIVRLIDLEGHTAESAAYVLQSPPTTAAWRYRRACWHMWQLRRAEKTQPWPP